MNKIATNNPERTDKMSLKIKKKSINPSSQMLTIILSKKKKIAKITMNKIIFWSKIVKQMKRKYFDLKLIT
jgi:hypothetical protein